MKPVNQKSKIEKKFVEYLKSQDISRLSIKNYRSDLSYFSGWLIFKVKTWGASPENLTEAIPFINKNTASKYKTFLTKNNVAPTTINRRLSTLRHFGRFLYSIEALHTNFAKHIKNTPIKDKASKAGPLIMQFEQHLVNEKVSNNTIKSYLSDVRQFFTWIEEQNLQNT